MDITIVGGDKRNLYLKELLEKDRHTVELIGFGKYGRDTGSMERPFHNIVIGGIPFLKDDAIHMPFGNPLSLSDFAQKLSDKHVVIAGGLKHADLPCKHFDLLGNEEFLQQNAMLTAEGILQIVLAETPFAMCGATAVVIGFGRIGSRIAKLLKSMGARVIVVVDNQREFNKAAWLGFSATYHMDMNYVLGKSDIVINTPPANYEQPNLPPHAGNYFGNNATEKTLIYTLGPSHFDAINPSSLIIDVSSKPYGVHENAKNLAKTMWVGNIPAKTAPKTGAVFLKKAIDEILGCL